MLRSELFHNIVIIECIFDSFLYDRVFYLFVTVDDILNLSYDFTESPLDESGSLFQVFQLRSCLHLIHLINEVF